MPLRKKDLTDISSIESILKKYDGLLERGDSETFKYTRIPFDISPLDILIGGGIPRKRITIFTGKSNTGKSFLASQVVKSVQKMGGIAAWIDTEISWDDIWMTKCGVDCNKLLLSQPTTGEEALDLIRGLMNDGIDLIVLDSVAGLVPSAVQEESFSYNPMAWQARFINQSLPKLLSSLKYGSALIAINQLRSSIGPFSSAPMPGGVGQTYFSHGILETRRAGWIEEHGEKVGFDINIIFRKSKTGGLVYQSCTVPFKLEGTFDILEVYIREALASDIIVKSGSWFQISWNGHREHGQNGLHDYFLSNPEEVNILKMKIGGIDKSRR